MRSVIFILCIFISACSGNWADYPARAPTSATSTQQIIDIGDKINVSIYNEADLSGNYTVLADGTIQIPLIGEISVKGLPLRDASSLISTALKQQGVLVSPKVTLSVVQLKTVKIMGEIQDIGEYPYSDNLTILGLVAKAGGFSYRAQQNQFDIVRKTNDGQEEIIKGTISTLVQAGDIIRVRERYF